MARIFITGSVDGLGRAAAEALVRDGHEVIVHARSAERAGSFGSLRASALGVVTGDLSDTDETQAVAEQVNAFGRMDAVIHNAGVYLEPERGATKQGHARTFAINTLAPYLLTALIGRPDHAGAPERADHAGALAQHSEPDHAERPSQTPHHTAENPGRPARLVYLSSGLHRSGTPALDDLDWATRRWDAGQAYADSKLHVTALAAALARHGAALTASVDPGWVPTRMGGPSATGDLEQGHVTQVWFVASDDVTADLSGGYWHHRRQQEPHPAAVDPVFQDGLLDALAAITGVPLELS